MSVVSYKSRQSQQQQQQLRKRKLINRNQIQPVLNTQPIATQQQQRQEAVQLKCPQAAQQIKTATLNSLETINYVATSKVNSHRSSGQYVAAANVEMFNNLEGDSKMGAGGTMDETAHTSQIAGNVTASPNLSGAQGGLTPNMNQYLNKIHSPNFTRSQPGNQEGQHRIIFNGTQSPLKGTAIDAILQSRAQNSVNDASAEEVLDDRMRRIGLAHKQSLQTFLQSTLNMVPTDLAETNQQLKYMGEVRNRLARTKVPRQHSSIPKTRVGNIVVLNNNDNRFYRSRKSSDHYQTVQHDEGENRRKLDLRQKASLLNREKSPQYRRKGNANTRANQNYERKQQLKQAWAVNAGQTPTPSPPKYQPQNDQQSQFQQKNKQANFTASLAKGRLSKVKEEVKEEFKQWLGENVSELAFSDQGVTVNPSMGSFFKHRNSRHQIGQINRTASTPKSFPQGRAVASNPGLLSKTIQAQHPQQARVRTALHRGRAQYPQQRNQSVGGIQRGGLQSLSDVQQHWENQLQNQQFGNNPNQQIEDMAGGVPKMFESNFIETLIFNFGTSGPANFNLSKPQQTQQTAEPAEPQSEHPKQEETQQSPQQTMQSQSKQHHFGQGESFGKQSKTSESPQKRRRLVTSVSRSQQTEEMVDKAVISREMSRKSNFNQKVQNNSIQDSNANSGGSAQSSAKQDNPVASFEKTKEQPLIDMHGQQSIADDKQNSASLQQVSDTNQSQPTRQSCPSDQLEEVPEMTQIDIQIPNKTSVKSPKVQIPPLNLEPITSGQLQSQDEEMEEEEEEDETNGINSSQLKNDEFGSKHISSIEIPQQFSTQEVRLSTQYVKEETIAEQQESIVEENNSAFEVENGPKLDEVPADNQNQHKSHQVSAAPLIIEDLKQSNDQLVNDYTKTELTETPKKEETFQEEQEAEEVLLQVEQELETNIPSISAYFAPASDELRGKSLTIEQVEELSENQLEQTVKAKADGLIETTETEEISKIDNEEKKVIEQEKVQIEVEIEPELQVKAVVEEAEQKVVDAEAPKTKTKAVVDVEPAETQKVTIKVIAEEAKTEAVKKVDSDARKEKSTPAKDGDIIQSTTQSIEHIAHQLLQAIDKDTLEAYKNGQGNNNAEIVQKLLLNLSNPQKPKLQPVVDLEQAKSIQENIQQPEPVQDEKQQPKTIKEENKDQLETPAQEEIDHLQLDPSPRISVTPLEPSIENELLPKKQSSQSSKGSNNSKRPILQLNSQTMQIEQEAPAQKSDQDKPSIQICDLGTSLKCIDLQESGLLVRSATTQPAKHKDKRKLSTGGSQKYKHKSIKQKSLIKGRLIAEESFKTEGQTSSIYKSSQTSSSSLWSEKDQKVANDSKRASQISIQRLQSQNLDEFLDLIADEKSNQLKTFKRDKNNVMKEANGNQDEATESQSREQNIDEALNQCSCMTRNDSLVQMYKPEDDENLDQGLANHIYDKFIEQNKKENDIYHAAIGHQMRKTKSETMALKKRNNLTFTQKLDGCMLQSLEDFIIDQSRRNTQPVRNTGGFGNKELYQQPEFIGQRIGQRLTGNQDKELIMKRKEIFRTANKLNTIGAITSPTNQNANNFIERSRTLKRNLSSQGTINLRFNQNENTLVKIKLEKQKNKAFGDFVKTQLDKENEFFEEIKLAEEPQRRKDRRQKNIIQRRFTMNNRSGQKQRATPVKERFQVTSLQSEFLGTPSEPLTVDQFEDNLSQMSNNIIQGGMNCVGQLNHQQLVRMMIEPLESDWHTFVCNQESDLQFFYNIIGNHDPKNTVGSLEPIEDGDYQYFFSNNEELDQMGLEIWIQPWRNPKREVIELSKAIEKYFNPTLEDEAEQSVDLSEEEGKMATSSQSSHQDERLMKVTPHPIQFKRYKKSLRQFITRPQEFQYKAEENLRSKILGNLFKVIADKWRERLYVKLTDRYDFMSIQQLEETKIESKMVRLTNFVDKRNLETRFRFLEQHQIKSAPIAYYLFQQSTNTYIRKRLYAEYQDPKMKNRFFNMWKSAYQSFQNIYLEQKIQKTMDRKKTNKKKERKNIMINVSVY